MRRIVVLKKLRKHLRQRRLAAGLAAAFALVAPAAPAHAAIGSQFFIDFLHHDITDNIVTNNIGLFVGPAGTSATMNGYSITTTGAASFGAYADSGGSITLTNVTVRTADANAYGLVADNAGSITMPAGGSVTTTGANSHGVYINNGGAINLTNVSVITTGAGSYALVSAGAGTITAAVNGQDIYGAGGLIAALGGTVNLTADGSSRLTGLTATAGGTINLTLNGNAAWTTPQISSLTNLTLNGGSVSFTAAAAMRRLDILGNLAGAGGTFHLAASRAAGLNDLISINGVAGGSHNLYVLGLGGSSADPRLAFKVVDLVNEGAAHTATFSGGGDIGAYRWALAQGAAVPAGYSGVDSLVDYFLYNTFVVSPRTHAAVSTAASPIVTWYGEMNEIKKRMGDLRLGQTANDEFWTRTYAGKYAVKPGGDQAFDQFMRGLEIGKDRPTAFAGGKRYLGWVAGAGRADNTFDAGGSGTTDSLYLGAYASWLWGDGSYLDIIGKHNWFSQRFTAPLLGGSSDTAAYHTTGVGLSAEIGKRFERGDGVFIEPQLELAALWTKGRNYTTANDLAVYAPATSSLQLRLGAVVGRNTPLTGGGSRQVYGKLSWVQELSGKSCTTVDTASFDSSLKGGRLVAGLGLVEDTAKRQLYLDLESAWGKTTRKPWGINIGCRWKL